MDKSKPLRRTLRTYECVLTLPSSVSEDVTSAVDFRLSERLESKRSSLREKELREVNVKNCNVVCAFDSKQTGRRLRWKLFEMFAET
ncbi:MAG: hypothetical protein ACTS44_01940 [Candidatus Hodgkinia cicadicola]